MASCRATFSWFGGGGGGGFGLLQDRKVYGLGFRVLGLSWGEGGRFLLGPLDQTVLCKRSRMLNTHAQTRKNMRPKP